MTQEQVDLYIMTNQKYLPAEKIVYVKQKLTDMDETKFSLVTAVEYKDPTTLLLVSIFWEHWGLIGSCWGRSEWACSSCSPWGCAEF